MNTWSNDEVKFIVGNLQLGTKDIYDTFVERFGPKRSYDSVQKKVKVLRDAHVDGEPSISTEGLTEFAFTGVSPQTNYVGNQEVPQTLSMTEQPTRAVIEEINQWLIETSNGFQGIQYQTNTSGTGVSLIILLSDNHFGKKTEVFNLQEARRRILEIPERIIDAGLPDNIDEVVVVLAGDLVEGEDIFSNQNGGLECPVIEQAQECVSAIWQMLLNIRATFDCVVRVETCPGNHGRMSKTADTRSNWDNVVYMMLGVLGRTHNDPLIQVNVNFDDFRTFQVKDKIGMAYHYGTKHLGTPAMQVKYAGWILSQNIDFIMHGHWHQWGVETYLGRPMIANGCMCGPDDLAKRMAKEEPARQAYFLVESGKPLRGFSFVEWD